MRCTRFRLMRILIGLRACRQQVTNLVTVCGDFRMTSLAELVRQAAPDPGGIPVTGIDGGTVEDTPEQTIISLRGGGELHPVGGCRTLTRR